MLQYLNCRCLTLHRIHEDPVDEEGQSIFCVLEFLEVLATLCECESWPVAVVQGWARAAGRGCGGACQTPPSSSSPHASCYKHCGALRGRHAPLLTAEYGWPSPLCQNKNMMIIEIGLLFLRWRCDLWLTLTGERSPYDADIPVLSAHRTASKQSRIHSFHHESRSSVTCQQSLVATSTIKSNHLNLFIIKECQRLCVLQLQTVGHERRQDPQLAAGAEDQARG